MNWQPPGNPGQQPWTPQPAGGPGYSQPPGVAPGPVYELSGWWRRVGATILDGLIVAIITGILSVPFGGFTSQVNTTGGGGEFNFHLNGVGLLINMIVFVLVIPLVMARTNGRTVGKIAAGIRVVREGGQPVDLGFALLRELLVKNLLFGFVAVITLFIATLLDYLWPLWDDQHRALHDQIVKSRVVRADGPGGAATWTPSQPYGAPPQPYDTAPWGQPAPPYRQQPAAPVAPWRAPPPQPPFPVAPPPPAAPVQPPPATAPVPPSPPPPGFDNPVPEDDR